VSDKYLYDESWVAPNGGDDKHKGIMILLFVAGDVIGGGETPMKVYSLYLPEDFPLQGTGTILQHFLGT